MSDTEQTISNLNKIQKILEDEISYAAITESENLHHKEKDCVVRAVTFSRGTRISILVFDANCEILHYSHLERRVSKNLLHDIIKTFFHYMVESEEKNR
jgi:hypothetical protein